MALKSPLYPKSIYQFLNELESRWGCLFLGVEDKIFRRKLNSFATKVRLKILESENYNFIKNLALIAPEGEEGLFNFLGPELGIILKDDLGDSHLERLADLFIEYLEEIVEDFRERTNDLI